MKTTPTLLLMAVLAAGTLKTFAQPSNASPPQVITPPAVSLSTPPSAAAGNATAAPGSPMVSLEATAAPSTNAVAVPPAGASSTNELRLNFRGVPLDLVLNYLSDAAGFIIVLDTQVRGNVDVWSDRPVTKDEAVDLLNSVLNKNGYAAIRNGRTLTIMDKNDAKTRDIPVKIGNDPAAIPNNDEMVTQIIPIRFVEAKQLVADLSPFVSPQATIVANDAGNSIVITDTQANIRHLAEIIRAIDNSAQGETEIRVFTLKYANPNDVANELAQIFPNNTTGTGQNQLPFRFGGRRGGPGGFFARMMAANGSNNQNPQIAKQTQVVAVADPRTQSVIVTASKDLMDQIAGMMEQLDVPSPRDQKVFVYHMDNADPQQALQVLQNMFQSTTTPTRGGASSSAENSALMNRQIQNANTIGNQGTTTTGFGNQNNRGVGGTGRLF